MRIQTRERERVAKSAAWVGDLQEQATSLHSLSARDCAKLLSALQACPPYVLSGEFDQLVDLKRHVQGRLDELDISDLVERINAMPAEKRHLLLERLRVLDQEAA